MTEVFTIYLPTDYRLSANVTKFIYDALVYIDPTLRDDITPEHAKEWFEGLITSNKNTGKSVIDKIMATHFKSASNLVYVDYYDGYFVFFDANKAMEAVKASVKEQYKLDITIGEIIISDIQQVEANHMSEKKLHQPCGKNGDENYPSKYVFENIH